MSSTVKSLIEKLGLAVHGEKPATAIKVIAYFTVSLLEKYSIKLDDYVEMMREASKTGAHKTAAPKN